MTRRVSSTQPCPKCRERGFDSRGDNLITFNDGGQHCFACNYHVHPVSFVPQTNEIPDNKYQRLLPADYQTTIPATAWKWLLKYGLTYQYWKNRTVWSPSSKRLVFKVGQPLAFSIGRYIPEADPDRVGVGVPHGDETMGRSTQGRPPAKWFTWGECHKHVEPVCNHTYADGEETIVLTEDLISAHKVGQLAVGVPLFGTKVHPAHIYYLLTKAGRVVLWQDKDQEGEVQKRALNLESLINRRVEIVVTDKDPKALSFNDIKGILCV